jgi:hypothetical protein
MISSVVPSLAAGKMRQTYLSKVAFGMVFTRSLQFAFSGSKIAVLGPLKRFQNQLVILREQARL